MPLAPDAQPIINGGLGALETSSQQETDSASVNGGISGYYQVGDTAAGQLANQAFVAGSLKNTISDIANQLGGGDTDIINDVVSAIQNVISSQASQNFFKDTKNTNFIGYFGNDVNQTSAATAVDIPAVSSLGGTINGIPASDFPAGGDAATLIKTFGSTPPPDSSAVDSTNDTNSALTPSQVSILVGREIPGDPSLANEVSQLLDNMLAKNTDTPSSSEQVLQSYLQELIYTSGAPGDSIVDQNGTSVFLSPDAQPIINGGKYTSSSYTGTSSFVLSTNLKINSSNVNGGISDYYQVLDTPVGQLANQAYVPGSLFDAITTISQQISGGDPLTSQQVAAAIRNVIGSQASLNFVEDASNTNFVGFWGDNLDPSATAIVVEIPVISDRGGSLNGISASDFPAGGDPATLIKTFGSTPPLDSSIMNPVNETTESWAFLNPFNASSDSFAYTNSLLGVVGAGGLIVTAFGVGRSIRSTVNDLEQGNDVAAAQTWGDGVVAPVGATVVGIGVGGALTEALASVAAGSFIVLGGGEAIGIAAIATGVAVLAYDGITSFTNWATGEIEKGNVSNAFSAIGTGLSELGSDVSSLASSAASAVANIPSDIAGITSSLGQDATTAWGDLSNFVKSDISTINNDINNFESDPVGSIDSGINTIKNDLSTLASDIKNGITTVENDITNLFSGLTGGGGGGSGDDGSGGSGSGQPGGPGGGGPKNGKPPYGGGPKRSDPLVIDLTGAGFNLTSLSVTSPYYDLSGNGFATETAWTGSGTGFLVEQNSDGSVQMLGNGSVSGIAALQTLANSGTITADGVTIDPPSIDSPVVVTEPDVFNSSDSTFSELRVWEDTNGNGQVDPGELYTLPEIGITSITLTPESSNDVFNGNTIEAILTYTMADGATGEIGEVDFETDPTYSTPDVTVTVPSSVSTLPQLLGYGTLYDLHSAMVQDPTLLALVQNFVALPTTTSTATIESAAAAIVYEWGGVTNVNPGNRGSYVDARQLDFLEDRVPLRGVGAAI